MLEEIAPDPEAPANLPLNLSAPVPARGESTWIFHGQPDNGPWQEYCHWAVPSVPYEAFHPLP